MFGWVLGRYNDRLKFNKMSVIRINYLVIQIEIIARNTINLNLKRHRWDVKNVARLLSCGIHGY